MIILSIITIFYLVQKLLIISDEPQTSSSQSILPTDLSSSRIVAPFSQSSSQNPETSLKSEITPSNEKYVSFNSTH